MIDIHSHILPGLDDGAEDLADSLALAKRYAAHGYTHVIATPHYVHGSDWAPTPAQVTAAVKSLQEALGKDGVHIQVRAGMEVSLVLEIPALLARERILLLAGSPYLLVEFPFQRLPVGWDEILFQVTAKGYRVLLAHPERCAHLAEDPALLEEIVQRGVYLEANWASFVGVYGAEVEKTVCGMVRAGYIHCLATDSHGAASRQMRRLRDAVLRVKELIGSQNVRLLAKENPRRLLRGEPLEAMLPIEAVPTKKRRWSGRLRRRRAHSA